MASPRWAAVEACTRQAKKGTRVRDVAVGRMDNGQVQDAWWVLRSRRLICRSESWGKEPPCVAGSHHSTQH